ncbi:MAG: alpha/beta hydrolase [Treponema sp.]|nr:alpha/beta hydrolase [Treponema sp.]
MGVQQYYVTMQDGTEVSVCRWMPIGHVSGVVHVSHGMVEHALRYKEFGEFLARIGFVCIVHDHRGHGLTGKRAETKGTGCIGMLAPAHGFDLVTDDIKELVLLSRKEFPDKSIFLLGHSFGSFVAQNFIEQYGTFIDGCILMGSAGPRPVTITLGKLFVSFLSLFIGTMARSRFVNSLTFGTYNMHIVNPKTPHDWLSREPAEVAAYEQDEMCGFIPTVSFFKDLLYGLSVIHKRNRMKRIPCLLPIYVLYGSADPVGGYGLTVRRLLSVYKRLGLKRVDSVCFDHARHELLHETNKSNVFACILDWIVKNK